MADQKITDYAELTSPDTAADWFEIIDASDTSMAATGTNKKITPSSVLTTLGSSIYKSNAYYMRPVHSGFSVGTPVQSRLIAIPYMVRSPVAVTFQSVAVIVTTNVASSTLRMGWYAVGTNGLPGALLYDLGTVDTAASTGIKTLASSFTIGPGWVFFAAVAQGGAPSFRQLAFAQVCEDGFHSFVTSGLNATGQEYVPYLSGVTGALPDPFGVPTAHGSDSGVAMPNFELRVT